MLNLLLLLLVLLVLLWVLLLCACVCVCFNLPSDNESNAIRVICYFVMLYNCLGSLHCNKYLILSYLRKTREDELKWRHVHTYIHTYIHHEFISIIQYNMISLINEQYDTNGPVERRETSSLLMSTCLITMTYNETYNVIQELHKRQSKSTN